MQLGDIEIIPLWDGGFRLDGGAMFGIIPKPAWEKRLAPDARNRVRLGLRPLLVRTPTAVVLVDTGMGEKWDARGTDLYALETAEPRLVQTLRQRAGLGPEDVTHLVFTHLHFDHAGGATRWAVAPKDGSPGKAEPIFSRARHVVQRQEWGVATDPDPRSRGSYRPEDFAPFAEAGLLDLIEGDRELVPGLTCRVTSGHTRAHQGLEIQAAGETAFYFGDLIPTSAHLDPPWVMGYDCYPTEASVAKARMLERAEREHWLVLFDHDPDVPGGYVRRDGKRWALDPVPAG